MNQNDYWYMGLALEEAYGAFKDGEVPVGAIVVDSQGVVLSRSGNHKEKNHDPCGHAELIAIKKCASSIENWRLTGTTLYVTLEPCLMCLGAMVHARIDRLIFGAYDPKGGAISLGYLFYKDTKLNHNFKIVGGVRHYECSQIISQFFRERRGGYRK